VMVALEAAVCEEEGEGEWLWLMMTHVKPSVEKGRS
jgi:hypothetical protein